jgi:hypothetical protein
MLEHKEGGGRGGKPDQRLMAVVAKRFVVPTSFTFYLEKIVCQYCLSNLV